MTSLDLDINNYNIRDLEKFFRLDTNKKYTAADIELREVTIREQLIKSGHVDRRFVKDLMDFTQLAKDWLIFVKCPQEAAPTVIPKNAKWDAVDYPRSAAPPITREGEILQRDKTPFLYTQPSAFFPGDLNPLSNRVLTKCLTIDTKFRDNYYDSESSDFTVQLPTRLLKVVSMELVAMELPISFYYISQSRGNHFLWIHICYVKKLCDLCKACGQTQSGCSYCGEASNGTEEDKLIIIPDGNYTIFQLVDAINTQLSPRDASGNRINAADMFSYVQFALDTGDSNFFGTGLVRVQSYDAMALKIQNISLDFSKNIGGIPDNTLLSTRLGWILGYQLANYDGNFIVGDTFAENAYFKYIYFGVDDFQNNVNNTYLSSFQTSIFQPSILARLSLNPKDIQSVYFANETNMVCEPRTYFGPVDIQRLQFRLFDEYGRILNTNHGNYSFCIKFQYMYNL
jgi:hypothetical protein